MPSMVGLPLLKTLASRQSKPEIKLKCWHLVKPETLCLQLPAAPIEAAEACACRPGVDIKTDLKRFKTHNPFAVMGRGVCKKPWDGGDDNEQFRLFAYLGHPARTNRVRSRDGTD